MRDKKACFSSQHGDWGTPQAFFDELEERFDFELDACADHDTAKCAKYYTKDEDSLVQAWEGNTFVNPPYGRGVGKWLQKAREHADAGLGTVVFLLPARTDVKWFHEYAYNKLGVSIEFIKGRLTFQGAPAPAPFPSMLVIFWRKG